MELPYDLLEVLPRSPLRSLPSSSRPIQRPVPLWSGSWPVPDFFLWQHHAEDGGACPALISGSLQDTGQQRAVISRVCPHHGLVFSELEDLAGGSWQESPRGGADRFIGRVNADAVPVSVVTHVMPLDLPGIQILLLQPVGIGLPVLRDLALFDLFILLSQILLLGHWHDCGSNDLPTTGFQTLDVEVLIDHLDQLFGHA